MEKTRGLAYERRRQTILTLVFTVICIIFVLPVLMVAINSFKLNTYVKTDTFALPVGEMWAGIQNFTKGVTWIRVYTSG